MVCLFTEYGAKQRRGDDGEGKYTEHSVVSVLPFTRRRPFYVYSSNRIETKLHLLRFAVDLLCNLSKSTTYRSSGVWARSVLVQSTMRDQDS